MSDVLAAIVSGILVIFAAIYTNYRTREKDLKMKEYEHKLERYKEFLGSFAEIGGRFKTYEAHIRFANAVNTLNIVASKDVLEEVYGLVKQAGYSTNDQDETFKKVILVIRRDLHPKTIENFERFEFPVLSTELRPGTYVDTGEEQ